MTETQNTSRRPGALIAMSGGVDSSVAAWLMQRDGFDCTGVTMRLTRNEAVNTEGLHTCCSERDIEDAAEVAYAMDIPYEVLDLRQTFRKRSSTNSSGSTRPAVRPIPASTATNI